MSTQVLLLTAAHSGIDVALLPQINNGELVTVRQPTIACFRSHAVLKYSGQIPENSPANPNK
jgi:hypothetical protein